jgi:hypothetical protein
MSRKRNAEIVRKYSAALERLFLDSGPTNPHDDLVEWWQHLRWERAGGPRKFRRVIDSIYTQLRATATARWGEIEGERRHQTFIEVVELASTAAFKPDHVPDYEALAEEMTELVFLPSDGKAGSSTALPDIVARTLLRIPPWVEIVHAVLTPKSWSVTTYDELNCPDSLAEIIIAKIGSEPIDFEHEMLLVLSWEDHPGAWFHHVSAPRPK